MGKTVVLCAGPVALLAASWLRLESPRASAAQALWIIGLAVAPSLLPRAPWRAFGYALASLLAAQTALHTTPLHLGRLLHRFSTGFLEFYDFRLPFVRPEHPRMHGVILLALFASCAAVALAVAARRPLLAALALVVGAGWSATLLTSPNDLLRGSILLALVLSLLFGVGAGRARRLGHAVMLGAAVVLAAVAASTSSAVANGQVLDWQNWDFYNRPSPTVDVSYVWDSRFTGLNLPKKVTTLLRIQAPATPTYWRATALETFDGTGWFEDPVATTAHPVDGRDELIHDPLLPQRARKRRRWIRQEVTVEALADDHLVGASVPVAFGRLDHPATYAIGGIAYAPRPLAHGQRYSAWSFEAHPTAAALAESPPSYPPELSRELDVAPGIRGPGFAASRTTVARFFARYRNERRVAPYKVLYATARRVVGQPSSPYAAAVALEAWFRSGGGFHYATHPPQPPDIAPLVAFVTLTHRGYCQHYAGAMTLMLRYLGIPARVAAGFTSGRYDRATREWTVTDHDAHTWVEVWFRGYGWIPFDPTPGRGELAGKYTTSSPTFSITGALLGLAAKAVGARVALGISRQHLRRTGAPGNPPPNPRAGRGVGGSSGGGFWRDLGWLVLVTFGVLALFAGAKLGVRRLRFATADPRRAAAACLRELRDFLADQGVRVGAGATPRELAAAVEAALGVDAGAFVETVTRARYGPPAAAARDARRARRELNGLRTQLRHSLTRGERARGLLSLRSLGLTG
jgi:transglutaminase-like putative cysteine protease